MPRSGAYVCSLTETVVQRIESVLKFMIACQIETERKRAAKEISIILRSKPDLRRRIGPKAKSSGSIL